MSGSGDHRDLYHWVPQDGLHRKPLFSRLGGIVYLPNTWNYRVKQNEETKEYVSKERTRQNYRKRSKKGDKPSDE